MKQPCCSDRWKDFGRAFVLGASAGAFVWSGLLFTIWLTKPEIINQHMLLLTVAGPSSILLGAILNASDQLHSKPLRGR